MVDACTKMFKKDNMYEIYVWHIYSQGVVNQWLDKERREKSKIDYKLQM